jgi:hypothetical protein
MSEQNEVKPTKQAPACPYQSWPLVTHQNPLTGVQTHKLTPAPCIGPACAAFKMRPHPLPPQCVAHGGCFDIQAVPVSTAQSVPQISVIDGGKS